jgi:BirA family biotin operon repressor/biotin-[acetyl-CoA-carboxylase] ligase
MSDAPNPVSLCQLLDREVSREPLLQDFLVRFKVVWDRQDVSSCYRRRLYRKGEWKFYCDAQGSFTGMLEDVRQDGRLILRDTIGQQRIYQFKEVQFII